MNEEIIIDGVNVAGCELYSKETGLCNYELSCKLKSHCRFKVNKLKEKLRYLEKENEELKKELNCYETSIAANIDRSISKRYEELLDENEKLKIQLKILETLSSPKILTNETLNIIMLDKAQKYETALEEIMEIVNSVEYYCELPKYTGKIKDIINKALESEENKYEV